MATLRYPAGAVPLAVLAAAELGGIPLQASADGATPKDAPPLLRLPAGDELRGAATLLRYMGRAGKEPGLYGTDPVTAGEVDEWIDYAPAFGVGSEFENVCAYADTYLSLRTFFVGYNLTLADLAVWAQLAAAGPRWESLRRSGQKFPALVRWFNTVVEPIETLKRLAAAHGGKKGPPGGAATATKGPEKSKIDGGSKKAAAKTEEEEVGEEGVKLPGAIEGQVVTRFPPEPSGYLHIGHAKAALMNEYFARKYKGRLIVRFDDTNPSKEKDEFVENILADLKTLGISWDGPISYTSDYFDELLAMCEKLLKEGKAYVDDTPMEQMRAERMDGIESQRRNQSVEENLALWKEMVKGSERGRQCCVRAKMDMQALNKSLRDPVYYRCNPAPHHRTGSKYKVYPTYDFACPYVDSKEGVTHALRSSEYHDRNEQYYRVLEAMGVRKVIVWDFSRLNFVYTLLSKRKLQWFVDTNRVEGWDDPRFPTVQGTIRRGLTVEALKQFILSQGASKNLNLMEWDKLWTMNKRIIDPVCPRHTAVLSEGKVLLAFTNGPKEAFVKVIPRHKKFEGAGKKATSFAGKVWLDQADAAAVAENEEVTLMDWGNAIIRKVHKDAATGLVTGLEGELHLEGSVKTTKLKLTWLADTEELLPLSLVDLDYLITKKKLEEDDDFQSVLNPLTRWETAAVGDSNMRNLQKGEILQLERKGYFIVDVPYVRASKPIVLISIPDGRLKASPGAVLAEAERKDKGRKT